MKHPGDECDGRWCKWIVRSADDGELKDSIFVRCVLGASEECCPVEYGFGVGWAEVYVVFIAVVVVDEWGWFLLVIVGLILIWFGLFLFFVEGGGESGSLQVLKFFSKSFCGC